MVPSARMVTFAAGILLLIVRLCDTQFRNYTSQYRQRISEQTAILTEEIQSNPDVNFLFHPERAELFADGYTFNFPISADYRIGILIDPCRYNNYNCCMNIYGSPEYPSLIKSNLEQERVFKYIVIASENEVATNYVLVNEDGATVPSSEQRSADDNAVLNTSCIGLNDPYTFCQGRNFAYQRSEYRPPCNDNNSTLSTLSGCYAPNGTFYDSCVQVAFTSSTFIPQCGVDDNGHCGTYLEIHMAHGTPYQDETVVISEVKVDQRNVTGYYTTILPMTWMKNSSKILCSYTESVYRPGSLVYILPSAPVCCCPPPFKTTTRVGSFECPKGAEADGAFAALALTTADLLLLDTLLLDYPYCPIDLTSPIDRIMCSAYDVADRRYYTRNCSVVYEDPTRPNIARNFISSDLSNSSYDGVCPYYDSCALTSSGECNVLDMTFTFVGEVGVVTAVDNDAVIPQVWVTFNDNRTSYQFSQEDIKLETNTKSMYEIWWVVRSLSGFTVQKRKGFNITSPQCTFDTTNNRYYPYAILQNGVPLDNSLTP